MEWLSQNWVWIVLAGAFLGMQFFGRHGGGGGGGCCGGGHGGGRKPDESGELPPKAAIDAKSGHPH